MVTSCVGSRETLYLQEADDHEDETVGADSPGEDFVQISLQQKLLQHKDQVRQHGILLEAGGGEETTSTEHRALNSDRYQL